MRNRLRIPRNFGAGAVVFDPSKVGSFTAEWDSDYGVSLRGNTISSDLTGVQWTPGNITVGGDSSGYTFVAASTGTSTRSVVNSVTSHGIVSGDQLRIQVKIKPGTKDWWYFSSSGAAQTVWVNSATGAVGTVGGSAVVESVTAASGGGYDVSILWPTDSVVVFYCTDGDGVATGTATASDVLGTIVLTDMVQPYVQSWLSRDYGGTTYLLQQLTTAKQPYLSSAGVVGDGVDDLLAATTSVVSAIANSESVILHSANTPTMTNGRILGDPSASAYLYVPGTSINSRGIFAGSGAASTTLADGSVPEVMCSSISAGGVGTLYTRTTQVASASVGTSWNSTGLNLLSIGASYFAGTVRGFSLFNAQLATGDRSSMVDYYVGKI
jgi:hypothetical protein